VLTPEEARVLRYLGEHASAPLADVARLCLPGSSPEWVDRIISNLDWLGYLTVLGGPDSVSAVVQITDRGRTCIR
jgi:hypothetical protein